MRIGFWNIRRKSYLPDIVDFTLDRDLDILVLAECELSSILIAKRLTESRGVPFSALPVSHPKIKTITRFAITHVTNHDSRYGGDSWNIHSFAVPNMVAFSLIGVHMPSKRFWDNASQSFEAVNLMNAIRDFEKQYGKNSIVIGDFNMNPYETGMTSAVALHAQNDAHVSRRQGRVIQNRFYDFFYNPMWNFLGDRDPVPGTYFYKKAVHNHVMWNTFDQVLLRPSLLNHFRLEDVEIVTKIGLSDLIDPVSKSIKNTFSDHLPIVISLNL